MAKCAYKGDGYRCDKKPVSGSKYCWRHTPAMFKTLKRLKALTAGVFTLIGVLLSLYALGFISIPNRPPLRIASDYSLDSDELNAPLKVPSGNIPDEYLNKAFINAHISIHYLDNLETATFAQREFVAVLDLTSKSPFEDLKLSPRMLLKLDDYQNTDIHTDAIIIPIQCGGGPKYPIGFNFVIQDADLIVGNIISSLGDEQDSNRTYASYRKSYTTLEPGKGDIYVAYINLPRPGSYKFLLGVEYLYDGEIIQQWTRKSFSVSIPNKYKIYAFEDINCGTTELPEKPIISVESCVFTQENYVCKTTTTSE